MTQQKNGPIVLVVDDIPEIGEMLGTFLKAQGFTPKVADSVAGARQVIAETRINLLITDVCMRDNGLTLAEQAKNSGIIVVVTSGNPAVIDNAENIGFPFLTKPFRLEELLNLVQTLLRSPP